jgi:vitamin B12 transporter
MLVDVHSQGHSYDDLANTKRLAGFATVDLNLGYAVSQDWLINLALNNLLDKEYETAKYYNQDGINALLTLRYTPK